jgi:RND superfamily putative drug exporter
MIFERLADFIAKRAKLLIAVWLVILLLSVPLALKAGDVLDYGTDSMAGPDAESIRGSELIAEYFNQLDSDAGDMFLLVVNFDDEAGKTTAEGIGDLLNGASDKPDITIMAGGAFPDDSATKGIYLYEISYNNSGNIDKIQERTPELREFIAGVLESNNVTLHTALTGSPAINYDTQIGAEKDLSRIDPFTILLILILVGLFFRSFVTSAMPPITIGAAFGVAMMALFVIGSLLNVFYITQMFLLVSMMGAGCDYCIFILARYREERLSGKDHDGALKNAIMWAGESISTSGLAVIIGFGSMAICSFSMISTMGIMLAIGVLIALLAALTLITSLLSVLGDRLYWPSRPDKLKEGGKALNGWYGKVSRAGHRYFVSSAKFSIKHAKVILVVAVLFTIPTAYITFTAPSSYDMVGAMSTGEAAEGLTDIEEYAEGGMISPDYALFELNEPFAEIVFDYSTVPDYQIGRLTWTDPTIIAKLDLFSGSLSAGDDNIGTVAGIIPWLGLVESVQPNVLRLLTDTDEEYAIKVFKAVFSLLPGALSKTLTDDMPLIIDYAKLNGQTITYDNQFIASVYDWAINYVGLTTVGGIPSDETEQPASKSITFAKITVITIDEAMSDRSMETIQFLDDEIKKFAAANADIIAGSWLTGNAAIMFEISEQVDSEFGKVELLAIALIFILLFFVMKSYLTPLRSILTILMSVAWTIALTHLIFSNLLGAGVLWIIPIILIVICLGLGMDYDILLTTRIKENVRHHGMTNDEAITAAVTHSGSVITICGLIMGGAFGTLMLSSTVMLQEFGFALCFAIIVDALLVRTYVVPAAMHLLGDWNWKGPKFLHKEEN